LQQKSDLELTPLTPRAIALLDETALEMCQTGTITREALVERVWSCRVDWQPIPPSAG
jgi:hypothetical protein